VRVRSPRLQREVWRFLCHEAGREGYWDALAGRDAHGRRQLRIGGRLARLASRDPDAQMPSDVRRAASAPQTLPV
jgi:hypothetical protein